jgi:hypothetical protein
MDNIINANSRDTSRSWNILNWNIRGLNSEDKCNAIKEKIEESACSIFCIQETKREHFDHSYIKKLAPKRFNKFAYSPSEGASGGILIGWNSSVFTGDVGQINLLSQSSSPQPIMDKSGLSPLSMVLVMVLPEMNL